MKFASVDPPQKLSKTLPPSRLTGDWEIAVLVRIKNQILTLRWCWEIIDIAWYCIAYWDLLVFRLDWKVDI